MSAPRSIRRWRLSLISLGPPYRGFRAVLGGAIDLTLISLKPPDKSAVRDGSEAPYEADFAHETA